MKIKIMFVILLLVSLSACSLVQNEDPPKNDDPIVEGDDFVGVFVWARAQMDNITPNFDINDSNATFFISDVIDENGSSYSMTQISGSFYDTNYHVYVGDEVTTSTFKAKVPVNPSYDSYITMYRIIKNEQGEYVLGEILISILQGTSGDSGTKFERETKTTKNGEEVKDVRIVDIGFVVFDPLQMVRVIQLDQQYQMIQQDIVEEVTEVKLHPDTHIVLIEETRIDPQGDTYHTVTSYGRKDANILGEIHHMYIQSFDQPLSKPTNLILRVSP